jgi:hypothetical protein
MTNRWKTCAIAALLLLLAVLTGTAQDKVDVTGKWLFNVQTAAGSGTPTIDFKQDAERLTGHYSGQLGEADLKGTVKGSMIEFSFATEVQGFHLESSYSGTIDKDTMKGTVSISGLGAEGTFTAKRQTGH